MPQSRAQVWLHIVFSTKDRRADLRNDKFQTEMFRMLAHHVRESNCKSVSVGGHLDHVHLLVGLSRTMTIARLVEHVKTETSRWAKDHEVGSPVFSWQRGYGAFSVSHSLLATVDDYIRNQAEHHYKMSFQDEYRRMCEKHEIDIDERYVWGRAGQTAGPLALSTIKIPTTQPFRLGYANDWAFGPQTPSTRQMALIVHHASNDRLRVNDGFDAGAYLVRVAFDLTLHRVAFLMWPDRPVPSCSHPPSPKKNAVNASFKLLAVAAIIPAVSCVDSDASAEDQQRFVSIFDGNSLDGWHVMNGAPFVAEDGVIKLSGGRGWLRSEKEYSDFVLKLEFRFMKPPRQDGGVFLRAGKEGKSYPSRKYEVQIENTDRMARIFGAKYQHDIPLTQSLLKPTGEWNEYVIKLQGSELQVRLNGQLVSSSDDAGKLTSGYIGFQAEDGFHEYRNLRIKDLSK